MDKRHRNKIIIISFFIIFLCYSGLNFDKEKQTGTGKKDSAGEMGLNTEHKILQSDEYLQVIRENAGKDKKKEKRQFWHEVKVRVEDTYEEAYIVLFYTAVNNTPKEALVYSPDFTKFYSPVLKNENQEGEIIFEPDRLEKGEWTIVVLDEKYMATYIPYVIEKRDYEKLKAGGDMEREVPY